MRGGLGRAGTMDRLLDPTLPDAEFVALLEQPLQVLYTSTSTQEVRPSVTLSPGRVCFFCTVPSASVLLTCSRVLVFPCLYCWRVVRVRQRHCGLSLTGVWFVLRLFSGLAVLYRCGLTVMPVP